MTDGKVLFEFATAKEFQTVNEVPARGAAFGQSGSTIVGGMLFVGSGYNGQGSGGQCDAGVRIGVTAMAIFSLRVNGQSHRVDVDPDTPLLFVLSDDLALRGPKFGCGLGQCGSCTVMIKGEAVRSCVTPVSTVGASEITTLEGLGTIEKPHLSSKLSSTSRPCSAVSASTASS